MPERTEHRTETREPEIDWDTVWNQMNTAEANAKAIGIALNEGQIGRMGLKPLGYGLEQALEQSYKAMLGAGGHQVPEPGDPDHNLTGLARRIKEDYDLPPNFPLPGEECRQLDQFNETNLFSTEQDSFDRHAYAQSTVRAVEILNLHASHTLKQEQHDFPTGNEGPWIHYQSEHPAAARQEYHETDWTTANQHWNQAKENALELEGGHRSEVQTYAGPQLGRELEQALESTYTALLHAAGVTPEPDPERPLASMIGQIRERFGTAEFARIPGEEAAFLDRYAPTATDAPEHRYYDQTKAWETAIDAYYETSAILGKLQEGAQPRELDLTGPAQGWEPKTGADKLDQLRDRTYLNASLSPEKRAEFKALDYTGQPDWTRTQENWDQAMQLAENPANDMAVAQQALDHGYQAILGSGGFYAPPDASTEDLIHRIKQGYAVDRKLPGENFTRYDTADTDPAVRSQASHEVRQGLRHLNQIMYQNGAKIHHIPTFQ